jgi:hypothetical protein
MNKTAVYKWVTCFSEGREIVTGKERSGWPTRIRTEEIVAEVHQIMHEYLRLTVRIIAVQANVDRETAGKILTKDHDMWKVCAKMFLKELTEEHGL